MCKYLLATSNRLIDLKGGLWASIAIMTTGRQFQCISIFLMSFYFVFKLTRALGLGGFLMVAGKEMETIILGAYWTEDGKGAQC